MMRQGYLRRKKIGAILIEFAFAVPVFMVLMYYIHDIPRMKLLYRKMQFVSNIMAATIQNIAKQKSGTDSPRVTRTEIVHAKKLAFLAVDQYGHKTAQETYTYPVIGTGVNRGYVPRYYYTFNGHEVAKNSTNTSVYSTVVCKTSSAASSSIYPALTIQNNEMKLIVECSWYKGSLKGVREFYGFLFFTPQGSKGARVATNNFFAGVTIITPIPGAFGNEEAPEK